MTVIKLDDWKKRDGPKPAPNKERVHINMALMLFRRIREYCSETSPILSSLHSQLAGETIRFIRASQWTEDEKAEMVDLITNLKEEYDSWAWEYSDNAIYMSRYRQYSAMLAELANELTES